MNGREEERKKVERKKGGRKCSFSVVALVMLHSLVLVQQILTPAEPYWAAVKMGRSQISCWVMTRLLYLGEREEIALWQRWICFACGGKKTKVFWVAAG